MAQLSASAATGRVMVNTAPERSDRFPPRSCPPWPRRTPARSRDQAPFRHARDRLSAPDRICRRPAPDPRQGYPALIHDLKADRTVRIVQPWMWIVVPAGAYFAALSRRLNRTCSNSTASTSHHRQVGRELDLDPCSPRILLARSSAVPTISPRSWGAAVGTTAPDSRRVMSRRLAMKRFRRSDSSMIVASSSALARSSAHVKIPQGPGGADDGRERRLRDRAKSR